LGGARKLVWLLLHSHDRLGETDKMLLAHLRQDEELVAVHDLAQRFQRMVRERRSEELDGWIQSAKASPMPELGNFAE
jgi:transposase